MVGEWLATDGLENSISDGTTVFSDLVAARY